MSDDVTSADREAANSLVWAIINRGGVGDDTKMLVAEFRAKARREGERKGAEDIEHLLKHIESILPRHECNKHIDEGGLADTVCAGWAHDMDFVIEWVREYRARSGGGSDG